MPTRNASAVWSGGGLKTGKGEFSGESGVIKFSFASQSFEQQGRLNLPRTGSCAAMMGNGGIFVAGGHSDHSRSFVAETEILNDGIAAPGSQAAARAPRGPGDRTARLRSGHLNLDRIRPLQIEFGNRFRSGAL